MVGASNFHLLGVGAEKSSLYRLALLGFDAYQQQRERGRFSKGALLPFCWIVGPRPRPIDRMNKERPIDDMTEPLSYYSLPHPPLSLKGKQEKGARRKPSPSARY
jgi:hypothetical protein